MNVKKKKKYNIHGIRFRMRLVILLVSAAMMVAVEVTIMKSVEKTVESAMTSRLESDIHYIYDMFGEGEWHIENGALYCGNIMVGDGTLENAYLDPFMLLQQNTGSFSYTFVRCSDEGLGWVGDAKTGYQQGHFRRVSGSTLSSRGEQIIGTYMDKEVADVLDEGGTFIGRANVVGGQVFCLYHVLRDNSGNIVGVIVVGRSIEEIAQQTSDAASLMLWIIFISVLLADIVLNIIMSRWLKKLDVANHYLIDIATGEFPQEPLDLHTKDELMVTADCINEMTTALKDKARLNGELEAAANMQRDMLPRERPEREEFDIGAAMHPAKEVGGDFYDYFMVDEDHLAVVIADVSGKGVPAALVMAISKMLIKDHTKMGMPVKEVFNEVNRLLCEGNETNVFVTAFLGVLELTTGRFTYVNAGHNPPLLRLGDGGFRYLDVPSGMLLGIFEKFRYGQSELIMAPGDRFFLYTDGVTEAMDPQDTLYGTDRLREYLNAHENADADKVLEGLKADIDAFSGAREQCDDITMLMLDFLKPSEPGRVTERRFDAGEESLDAVIDFTKEMLADKPVPKKVATQILTAVDEIFTNIASYAYPEGNGSVWLSVSVDENTVRLRFTDSGIAFDPMQTEDPDVDMPADEREIGGLGIFLVKKTMDRIAYARKDGKNVLKLQKIYRD